MVLLLLLRCYLAKEVMAQDPASSRQRVKAKTKSNRILQIIIPWHAALQKSQIVSVKLSFASDEFLFPILKQLPLCLST